MVTTPRGMAAIAILLAASTPALQSQPAVPQTIRVGILSGGRAAVREMPLEEYVAGVVAGEAFPGSSPAALEALAITVRTYAVANRGRHGADGFDLCDQTHCQVLRTPTAATAQAAAATAGRVLVYDGAPASIFYSASCGGHTERPSEVWPGALDPPFLRSQSDAADEGEPAWSADLTAEDLGRALRAAGFRGSVLRDVAIVARNDSTRVTRLRLSGFTPAEVSGPEFRALVSRTLGVQSIKSTAFDVSRTANGFHFTGRGFGHGVGLCVLGSVRLAARGETADEILGRYFQGATISGPRPAPAAAVAPAFTPASMPAPIAGITLALPAADRAERDAIHDLAARTRDRLLAELGVPRPAEVSLRFHPTVDSYQRSTGRAWFTGGATTGTQVDFPPLSMLRERGMLERAIRHELVHVLTDRTLAGRPEWVREGAALYFSRDSTQPDRPGGRAKCPSDRELLQPSSPGELSVAYDHAAACFAARLRAGKSWQQIGR